MKTNEVRERLIRRLREKARQQEEDASPAKVPQPISLLNEGRELRGATGGYCCIRVPCSHLQAGGETLADRFRQWTPASGFPSQPEHLLCLDLETTGLSGERHPLFLVGLARWQPDHLEVIQLFARTPAEEEAVLVATQDWLRQHEGLLTFNGRAFDWPYLRHRFRHHGLAAPPMDTHVDVLHLARRHIGSRYGNCRLQTLEAQMCARSREGDIPGASIPGAYHHYLNTGQTNDIERILYHNALDLLTTTELLVELNDRRRL